MRQSGEVARRERLASGQAVLLAGEWFEGKRQGTILVLYPFDGHRFAAAVQEETTVAHVEDTHGAWMNEGSGTTQAEPCNG